MPALVDTEPKGGGAPVTQFEFGAIMMYLAEKFGRFWPQDVHGKWDVVQWVMWQMGNQGPKFGEQGHFFRAVAGSEEHTATSPMPIRASAMRCTGSTA